MGNTKQYSNLNKGLIIDEELIDIFNDLGISINDTDFIIIDDISDVINDTSNDHLSIL